MPRHADPLLENRILDAAQRLWKKGGEKALTMRAVARTARTNTPAVYRRFRDRNDILRALLQRTRQELIVLLEGAPTLEMACENYVDFALSHPYEYELFYQHGYELFHKFRSGREPGAEARPGIEALKRKLAERLGGAPSGHTELALALLALGHGTAILFICKLVLPEFGEQMRSAFTAAVGTLLRDRERRPQKRDATQSGPRSKGSVRRRHS